MKILKRDERGAVQWGDPLLLILAIVGIVLIILLIAGVIGR